MILTKARMAELWTNSRLIRWLITGLVIIYLPICLTVGWYWGQEPDVISVSPPSGVNKETHKMAIGYVTVNTLLTVADTLLHKPGGYLSNDVLPPGVWLDNMRNWEFGVLVQVRDLARSLRQDFSRAQSQSTENKDLVIAEPQFNFDSESWMLPATENEYKKGIVALTRYRDELADIGRNDAQFYARADNLARWLETVESRLGSLSQRLSASVGPVRFNTDLAGDANAKQSTPKSDELLVQTPWLQIDDIFYEARGTAWALIPLLKAIEIDFADVLQKKNASASVKQIIRELEATQKPIWSPMILNGGEFGLMANHSLVMAAYIARANAGIINLRQLLSNG